MRDLFKMAQQDTHGVTEQEPRTRGLGVGSYTGFHEQAQAATCPGAPEGGPAKGATGAGDPSPGTERTCCSRNSSEQGTGVGLGRTTSVSTTCGTSLSHTFFQTFFSSQD